MDALGLSNSLGLGSHELVVVGRALLIALAVADDGDVAALGEELSDVAGMRRRISARTVGEGRSSSRSVDGLDGGAVAGLKVSLGGLDVVDQNVNLGGPAMS